MFYVLDGALTMRLGDDTLKVEAGTFVCVPPDVKHTFSNPSDTAVRVLNFNTPAGWEGYMRDLAASAKSGPHSGDDPTDRLQLRLPDELSHTRHGVLRRGVV